MKSIFAIIALFYITGSINCEQCPSGGEIYEWGIDEQGVTDIINEHNKYRQMLMNGEVPNQPQAINIKMTSFDDILAEKGRVVSQQCQMKHVKVTDDRWTNVGQNLYISWSSGQSPGQNWTAAAASWYKEHKNFIYPNGSNGGITGHYTQLIWHSSELVGCDFISFYDVNKPRTPYAKLYTCNYGPSGNTKGKAPYDTA